MKSTMFHKFAKQTGILPARWAEEIFTSGIEAPSLRRLRYPDDSSLLKRIRRQLTTQSDLQWSRPYLSLYADYSYSEVLERAVRSTSDISLSFEECLRRPLRNFQWREMGK